ncbi:MAG TPA: hypothetical protein VEA63_10925, partial [Opitutus sp.]|nr:hypothetical protein [Opitutus sp.]
MSSKRGIETAGDEIRFTTESGRVIFGRGGELRAIENSEGRWQFAESGAFPRIELHYPKTDEQPETNVTFDDTVGQRTVQWSSGELFHKLRIRLAQAEGAALEVEFRIPRHGREVTMTTAVFPGPRKNVAVRQNRLLEGRLTGGEGTARIVEVPAGIRRLLRAEHAYTVSAVTTSASKSALLAVPLVIGGGNGEWSVDENGGVVLRGAGGLQRGDEGEKNTLHAFWTEVRLVPTAAVEVEPLWQRYREHVQPLVAIVEEPGMAITHLNAALRAITGEMKPIGWRQEAAHALVRDDVARMGRILKSGPKKHEADVAALLGGARAAQAKLTNNGERKVLEHEKGRAYGGLDPYHVTYTQSAAAALSLFGEVPERVGAVNHAMARAVREFGGRTDAFGSPYIDCFNRALNMQMGPMLFGLTAGAAAGDADIARFYRDLATAPAVQAVFGRGQRPYSGAPAKTADQTDYLYQAICDFWLRTTELLANEDLQLHALAYSRYTDCVDVMADRYHGVASRDKPGAAGQARANFFRGQAHTHRWLGWSAAPYIRLLETPEEGAAIGLTEAVRHTLLQKGRWKNWPDLTFYALADLLVRKGLGRYERPNLPVHPTNVVTRADGRAIEISWDAVPEAAEYRVYRADGEGGPYRWLNSSYVE